MVTEPRVGLDWWREEVSAKRLRERFISKCCGFRGCFPQEGKEFAESQSLLFMETSARLNHQVTEVFSAVGE